jgi:UPF0755 protein
MKHHSYQRLSGRHYCSGLLVVALLSGFLLTAYAYHYIHQQNRGLQADAGTLVVTRGQDFDQVLTNLHQMSPISHPNILRLYGHFRGITHTIHTGEYLFDKQDSWYTVLRKLSSGDTYQRKFTIVEGWNIYQLLAALQADPHIQHTIDYSAEPLMAGLPSLQSHPEGAYLPDTYYYSYPASDKEILARARDAMQQHLAALQQGQQCTDQSKSSYDILVLASLLEKEAASVDEMAVIAGVINNRLTKRMPLGIDAAVRYGVKNFSQPLLQSQLQTLTPYNTYKLKGLPPTPISNPSSSALLAACNPVKTEYLYYVSMDGKRHYFSKTLKEHHQAVHKYLR